MMVNSVSSRSKKSKKKKRVKKRSKLDLNVSAPENVADICLLVKYTNGDTHSRLLRLAGEWLVWNNDRYESYTEESFRAELRQWLSKQALFRPNRSGVLAPAECTIRVVSELIDAMISKTDHRTDKTAFFWLNERKGFADPISVVGFENGLLDVETMELHDHTPNWFARRVLPYLFDPKAACPKWKKWLRNTSGNDKDWESCLQLWFGYNLTPDTSKQRFAHFYGLPRSGKGTATRVLIAILGRWNTASPTLSQLGSNQYMLCSLVDKLTAIIPDAVIGRNIDSKIVMELLSSVIGEDRVDVNRKYLPVLNSVKVGARFTITSNEPLKWPDLTNKMSGRSLIFPFLYSFAGKENAAIEKGLMTELPGIVNWALEGLVKLRNGSPLLEPKIGQEKHKILSELDSPLRVFCDACLRETEEIHPVTKKHIGLGVDTVYSVWMAWSKKEGRLTKGQTRTYIKALVTTALPKIKIGMRGPRGRQEQTYIGLELTDEGRRFMKAVRRSRRTMSSFKESLEI